METLCRPSVRDLRSLVTAGLTWALPGCATFIVPPASPSDSVDVFVVDHGRTSSLVIPTGDGGMRRYAYGDWNYYALQKTDLGHGLAALFWPTQGALGRAALEEPATAHSVRFQTPLVEFVHTVAVERSRVQKFESDMEALYRAGDGMEVENRTAGLSFVHHPRPYTYFWNSNHAVASWLRDLGAATRGPSFRADWRVVHGD